MKNEATQTKPRMSARTVSAVGNLKRFGAAGVSPPPSVGGGTIASSTGLVATTAGLVSTTSATGLVSTTPSAGLVSTTPSADLMSTAPSTGLMFTPFGTWLASTSPELDSSITRHLRHEPAVEDTP